MELSALSLQVRGLSVLRGLQQHPLVHAYLDVFDALGQNADAFADRYGALCAAQFACRNASRAILDAVHYDVNTLTDTIAAPAPALLDAATRVLSEMKTLPELDITVPC